MRYRASQGYIDRELAKVSAEYDSYAQPEHVKAIALKNKRLEIDLAEILTGPTCGAEAERLAFLACNISSQDVAEAMREASDRYFGDRGAAKGSMDYYITFLNDLRDYEIIAVIKGHNAETRAHEYAKQILLPDKKQVHVFSQDEYLKINVG